MFLFILIKSPLSKEKIEIPSVYSSMPILTSKEDFWNAPVLSLITIQCDFCSKVSQRIKKRLERREIKIIDTNSLDIFLKNKKTYCSSKCGAAPRIIEKIPLTCKHCDQSFSRDRSSIRDDNNKFCSQRCSNTFNSTNNKGKIGRSKLEKWIEVQLLLLYPSLPILFNNRSVIKSEIDIYIPSLKLAFELNGPFHYEPIFGEELLSKIQNNDSRKFQACLERGIELCIIDNSPMRYFKPEKAIFYLNIITKIINEKLAARAVVETAYSKLTVLPLTN